MVGREFEGRVALVTGSSKGIGRATAERLARGGASVVINARREEDLRAAEQELRAEGLEVSGVLGSVTADGEPERFVAETVERYGAIDLVVNVVAVNKTHGALMDVQREPFAKTMTHNTWPTLALAQAAVAHGMRDGGAIVAVSSIGGHSIHPYVVPYNASKAALELLIRGLARELGPRGIRVNGVAPGLVATDMSRVLWEGDQGAREAELLPLGRLGRPEDIAAAIVWMLSPGAAWTTGQILDVDGGRLLVGAEPAGEIGVFRASSVADG